MSEKYLFLTKVNKRSLQQNAELYRKPLTYSAIRVVSYFKRFLDRIVPHVLSTRITKNLQFKNRSRD